MDEKVVMAKLESLRRCVERLGDKTPASVELLLEDSDLQDIICLNLERAVQTCVDIASHILAGEDVPAPASMAECFEDLCRLGMISPGIATRMRKAVGFRNIAVHSYQEINWKVVYSIITTRLDDFVDYSRAVSKAAGLIRG